ncbi:hypothetical protein D9757_012342 [Collybiopsis confluens]|uniref:NADP-dependent oxidoreductase domain-containing protein n=1 Tax=Collybiopsis confluens TaxID=2823264 RepID=A0A8H5FZR3_9AGAR|nr:hypothetical protein D9757_012342 [Collybiopsis confluens]
MRLAHSTFDMSAQSLQVVYRQLGKSGLRVSVPIIGAMSFGTREHNKWSIPDDEALPILKYAWDQGINTIDTANIYSNGDSERIIGKFLKKYSIPRSEIIVATKVLGLVGKEPGLKTMAFPGLENTRNYVNQSGLSRAAIFNAVDACLERLDTPYIDLLQIHRFDTKVPAEETMKALHDLVQAGKVRYLGVMDGQVLLACNLSIRYSTVKKSSNLFQAAGSLARPSGEETTRSASYKGTPFEKKFSESDQLIISRVQELASKYSVSMAQISLSWVETKVTSPIVGVNSEKRVLEAIPKEINLTPEDIKYLEEP